ncbi:leucine-rich repeat, immunoglobulin-like domain and transmembrane domain-containing protein 1 isoform X1 [Macrotis lagotis]|uniref:leucine-rich repeat, immunoglobulin-like domain and transmembrane domain-containing protein 1 isoform X1 n=1 Tax=Macrotis lagotis TaxID=92651 RepID=UPI003D68AA64
MEGPQLVTKEPTPPKILIFHSPPLQKIRGDHTYQPPVLPTHKQLYASLTPRQQEHFLKQTQLYIRMFCTGLCGFTFILLLCISPMPWVQFLMAENGLELYAGLWTPCEHELCWSNVPSRPYYLQISRIFFLFSNLTAFTILLCVISSCRHKKNFISGLDRVIAILCLISGANLFFCLVLFLMQVKKYTSYTMGSSYLWIFHFNWWGSFFYIVAGLQDNPWVCDCSLYEMVQILHLPIPHMAFIDPKLKCSTPWSLAGVAFSQLELRKCQRPEVYTSVAKVKTLLGSTVFLRCGATGVPSPELIWRRADGHQLNGTVHQETSSDGMSWSLLGLPEVSHHDSGEYICKAKNSLGATEASVSLIITEAQTTAEPQGSTVRSWPGEAQGVEAAAYNELVARYASTTSGLSSLVARPTRPDYEKNPALQHFHMNALGELSIGSFGAEQVDRAKDLPLNQLEPAQTVKSVKVVGDTYHSVTLVWKAPQVGNNTMFSILYAIFGEKDMKRVSVDPGKTKVTIEGLMPKTKYVACVCVRGLVPKKEQCIIFSTDEVVDAEGTQRLINIVVISIASVIAVPLTLLVCCGSLKRRYQKFRLRKKDENQGSYVTFERLGPGEDGVEDLARDSPEEGDRLLSLRSSVDSYAPSKIESLVNEYFC